MNSIYTTTTSSNIARLLYISTALPPTFQISAPVRAYTPPTAKHGRIPLLDIIPAPRKDPKSPDHLADHTHSIVPRSGYIKVPLDRTLCIGPFYARQKKKG